jgi:hypothetical protein
VHGIGPGLGAVRRAPDRPRLGCGFRVQLVNREQKDEDGEVVDFFQRLLQDLAVRTIRVLKDSSLRAPLPLTQEKASFMFKVSNGILLI